MEDTLDKVMNHPRRGLPPRKEACHQEEGRKEACREEDDREEASCEGKEARLKEARQEVNPPKSVFFNTTFAEFKMI